MKVYRFFVYFDGKYIEYLKRKLPVQYDHVKVEKISVRYALFVLISIVHCFCRR